MNAASAADSSIRRGQESSNPPTENYKYDRLFFYFQYQVAKDIQESAIHHHYHFGFKADSLVENSDNRISNGKNTNRVLGGVDEAGRGAVMGPMVVAGVSLKEKDMHELARIGVRDSKELSRRSRSLLYGQIIDIARSICVCVVESAEIDIHVVVNRLNHLEALAMAQVIDNMQADSIFVDCCDVNPEKFRTRILSNVKRRLRIRRGKMDVFSFHHADRLHLAVSAASIVAKVIREEHIGSIKRVHQDIGSGYPCDKITIRFIRSWIAEVGTPPSFVRSSWLPVRRLLSEKQQQKKL
jgi:ribonuclease HII